MKLDKIRNFSIIAHIDHGKSTLADRLIEFCGALAQREMQDQVLDSMEIEQERGITIKAQTVRLMYKAKDGEIYLLNLIDTPGHVDFSYEVSRSLAACEGSLLVVDSTQGVEAQTLANVYLALDNSNEIFPVLNKIDLPASRPKEIKQQIEDLIGIEASESILVSAKEGQGIDETLEAIVKYLPPPKGEIKHPLKALLVDSWYDKYIGVIILVRIFDGSIKKGMEIKMMGTGAKYTVEKVGYFTPKKYDAEELKTGEVGFIVANIKKIADCKIGDTITSFINPCIEKLPGFKPQIPVVFCGLYPSDAGEFNNLKIALEKLSLNDSSFTCELESSTALGFGYRCGFLGLLHLEIVQERLEREFELEMVTTAPSVIYEVTFNDGAIAEIHNPVEWPESTKVKYIKEPWVKATIIVPDEFLGAVLALCTDRRGIQVTLNYIGMRVMLVYKLPLNEIVFDFYDRLKSCSKGYASFDWSIDDKVESDLVKLSILINGENVDALSVILHKSRAEERGREICLRLKELIPRQLIQIALQASIAGRIIARETIKPLRKDVLAKCYGGDISRKRKLLEKQKAGKKRMKSIANVDIPQAAFIAALKIDNK